MLPSDMKTYVPLAKPSHFYICGINMFESLLFHGFTQKIIQKILAVSINIKKIYLFYQRNF